MLTVLAPDQADSNPKLSRAWAFTAYCPAAAQLCDWLAVPQAERTPPPQSYRYSKLLPLGSVADVLNVMAVFTSALDAPVGVAGVVGAPFAVGTE
jgi:hypothetical protein